MQISVLILMMDQIADLVDAGRSWSNSTPVGGGGGGVRLGWAAAAAGWDVGAGGSNSISGIAGNVDVDFDVNAAMLQGGYGNHSGGGNGNHTGGGTLPWFESSVFITGVITAGVILPLSLVRKISALRWSSAFAVIALMYTVVLVTTEGVMKLANSSSSSNASNAAGAPGGLLGGAATEGAEAFGPLTTADARILGNSSSGNGTGGGGSIWWNPTLDGVLEATPLIVFSFGCQAQVIPLFNAMPPREQTTRQVCFMLHAESCIRPCTHRHMPSALLVAVGCIDRRAPYESIGNLSTAAHVHTLVEGFDCTLHGIPHAAPPLTTSHDARGIHDVGVPCSVLFCSALLHCARYQSHHNVTLRAPTTVHAGDCGCAGAVRADGDDGRRVWRAGLPGCDAAPWRRDARLPVDVHPCGDRAGCAGHCVDVYDAAADVAQQRLCDCDRESLCTEAAKVANIARDHHGAFDRQVLKGCMHPPHTHTHTHHPPPTPFPACACSCERAGCCRGADGVF